MECGGGERGIETEAIRGTNAHTHNFAPNIFRYVITTTRGREKFWATGRTATIAAAAVILLVSQSAWLKYPGCCDANPMHSVEEEEEGAYLLARSLAAASAIKSSLGVPLGIGKGGERWGREEEEEEEEEERSEQVGIGGQAGQELLLLLELYYNVLHEEGVRIDPAAAAACPARLVLFLARQCVLQHRHLVALSPEINGIIVLKGNSMYM